jgi:hypothetical protein
MNLRSMYRNGLLCQVYRTYHLDNDLINRRQAQGSWECSRIQCVMICGARLMASKP